MHKRIFLKNKRSHKIVQKKNHTHHSKCLYHKKKKKMNPGLGSTQKKFKTLQLIRCPNSIMYSRYNFKKLYLSIFYMSKINFKKPRIKDKYRIKFKKPSVFLFLQKVLECPELGESRAHLKTYLYLLFHN